VRQASPYCPLFSTNCCNEFTTGCERPRRWLGEAPSPTSPPGHRSGCFAGERFHRLAGPARKQKSRAARRISFGGANRPQGLAAEEPYNDSHFRNESLSCEDAAINRVSSLWCGPNAKRNPLRCRAAALQQAFSSRNPASAGFKRFRHRLEGFRIAMNDTCSKSG
jgi:hypothetical protein